MKQNILNGCVMITFWVGLAVLLTLDVTLAELKYYFGLAFLVLVGAGFLWAEGAQTLFGQLSKLALPAPVIEDAAPALPAPVIEEAAPALPAPVIEEAAIGGQGDRKASFIIETLAKFDLPVEFVHVNDGPRLKQYCFSRGIKERGGAVKISEIRNLKEELAFSLSDDSVLITRAIFKGRSYIGIATENDNPTTVRLEDILTGDEQGLEFGLGADIVGNPVTADLSRMPHLLISGATNSGKSVCVNAIIVSLLRRLGPDQLKLLMIDPKMVELMPYNGIPHLVVPVVTDMERVVGALTWALREMERRYKLFSEAGKRNHESYNKWAVKQGKEELPYIVIIIDELADLMMTAANDVEQIICRLAQKSRATGMHLILATQRPSVDVVTGLIKANIPARISFAVASSIDSRVILDQNGAENLLGRGDMLYQASDSGKLQRLQGCFVSDEELEALVNHWMRYSPKKKAKQATESPWGDYVEELAVDSEPQDELLPQAIEIAREHQHVSTSLLQRKLRIGYKRAAHLVDALEEKGIIAAAEPAAEPRTSSARTYAQNAQNNAFEPVFGSKAGQTSSEPVPNHPPNHPEPVPNHPEPVPNHPEPVPNHPPNHPEPVPNHPPNHPEPVPNHSEPPIFINSIEELIKIGLVRDWSEDVLIENLLRFDGTLSGNRIRDLVGGTKKRIQRKVSQIKERLET